MAVLDTPTIPQLVIDQAAAAAHVTTDIAAEALRLALLGGPDAEVPGWQDDAFCKGVPPDAFYPDQGAGWRDAVAACNQCAVQSACLAYAIATGERSGVWGGTTQAGRIRLRKVLREAGVLGVTGEDAYLAWVGDGADHEPIEAPTTGATGQLTPRPHQVAAVTAITTAIAGGGACQIAMATASGKTHVGLWAAERLEARRTLVLVPNLSLVEQTARLWRAGSTRPVRLLAVCSDAGDIDIDATTDPSEVRAAADLDEPLAVIATYQSSAVLAAAGVRFDLTIADEAHHLAGAAEKAFAAVVRGEIPTDRTLYMTATPRRFHRKKGDVDLVSMDDPVFGPRVYELLLSDAVADGIVADYRVIVAAVDRATFDRVARHPDLQDVDPHLLAGAIAVVRTMGAERLASCVSFHTRIDRARTFAGLVGAVAEALPAEAPAAPGWAGYLHGGASVRIRQRLLQRLVDERTWGVVANAKTLGEGVDVPTLDAIAIVDPKTAEADVMQAVGRALRRPGTGAKVGTVLLPVLLAGDADPADPLAGVDERSLEIVSSVLRALRGHDTQLSSRLDRTRRSLGQRVMADVDQGFLDRRAMQRRAARGLLRSRVELHVPGGATGDLAGALALHVIRESTAAWEEAYGRLVAWVDEHDELPPQIDGKVPDETGTFSLGAWCTVQRTRRRRGLLEPDRVALLETVPRWQWDPRDAQWWTKYDALAEHVRQHHDIPSRSYVAHHRGVDLGSFVNVCRSAYVEGGKDGGWLRKFPDRVAALEQLPGWVWNVKDAEWETHFAQLQRWVKLTGHANPGAADLVDGFDIGKWVQKQRSRIRGNQWVDRRRGDVIRTETLSDDRTARLRALPGWVEHTREASWDAGYARLVAYVEQHGQLPAQGYITPDGHRLGSWILKNRQVWLRDHGGDNRTQKGFLGPEREHLLEQIPGWTWQPLEERWSTMLDGLRQHVAAGGDASRVPQHVTVEGAALGNWVIGQRMAYRRGKLAAERVAQLEQIPGWAWDGQIGAKSTSSTEAA